MKQPQDKVCESVMEVKTDGVLSKPPCLHEPSAELTHSHLERSQQL